MNLQRLKERRVEKKFTQQQLSTAIGMTFKTYSKKENGHREFTVSELEKICFVLEIEASELLEIKL
ncbi:helix-turn-helix domain-containing protein [Clostridioides sp. ZZV15-6597]|uniref:helix-turn-helix domain-containing protein n=1 Tax=Clostridioides sp. ZZV15-6597 TaxID=2811500 RepID=UPI001D1238AD|nr:helix-turn-helix transcriptional regulator [Clostridioides sp. ZZV15-6597]HBF1820622.1 helix-turn-helix transcriptional regulator [Clostridioides difficile]